MVLDDPAGVEPQSRTELGIADELAIPGLIVVAIGTDRGRYPFESSAGIGPKLTP